MIDTQHGQGAFIDAENNSMRSIDEMPHFLIKIFLFWNYRTPSRQRFKRKNLINQTVPPLFSDYGVLTVVSNEVDIIFRVGESSLGNLNSEFQVLPRGS